MIIASGGLLLYFLLTVTLYSSDVCIQDSVKVNLGVSILESVLLLFNALRLMLQIVGLHESSGDSLSHGQMNILILVCAVNVSICLKYSSNALAYAL